MGDEKRVGICRNTQGLFVKKPRRVLACCGVDRCRGYFDFLLNMLPRTVFITSLLLLCSAVASLPNRRSLCSSSSLMFLLQALWPTRPHSMSVLTALLRHPSGRLCHTIAPLHGQVSGPPRGQSGGQTAHAVGRVAGGGAALFFLGPPYTKTAESFFDGKHATQNQKKHAHSWGGVSDDCQCLRR